jgi:ribosomal protein L32
MKCPHCQAENRDGAEFCGDCGKSLRSEVICPQCGNTNPRGKRFCDKCGHSLNEQVAQPSLSASVPTPAGITKPPVDFANGRYQVKKFLGEGGKKKVYLAHDTELDRDVVDRSISQSYKILLRSHMCLET